MLKLTNHFIEEIKEGERVDLKLVGRMTLINQEKEVDIKFCVLDLPELKRRILEE
jgi:hypothetical protein